MVEWVPYVFDGTNIEDRGRQTIGMAILNEGVQERVCGSVVGLSTLSHETRERTEHNHEVQRNRLGRFVKIPGSVDLGLDGGFPVADAHFIEFSILNTREVSLDRILSMGDAVSNVPVGP